MFRCEGLEDWRLGVDYARDCYGITANFPKYENFSLADQLRRAAVSISSNIAEGSVGSKANFIKYINIAIGSTLETVNLINFASEIGYTTPVVKEEMYERAEKLIRKLRSLSKSLNQ